ncbi:MAG: biotin--[acetyl-CoA-carboxylase] ligase [Methanomassiliicoccales archaeon]|nr:biotin--[acetyl-CoA-carboxylase] ligase [Methanomassiliicoccales archaeon]
MSLKFRVVRETSVISTNDSVRRLAIEGEPEGFVAVARTQTGGRGRLGNAWSSPPGGLYMSILLRPKLRPDAALGMTVFSCAPIGRAIEKLTGIKIGLKWPNDLEIDGRKVGGILVEGASTGGGLDFAILGIGINANTEPPNDEAPNAISIRSILGRQVDLDELSHAILTEFEAFYDGLKDGSLREEYVRRSSVLGRRVELSSESEAIKGTATGIGESGSLLLRADDGQEIEILSATGVSLRVSGRGGGA